MHREQQQNTIKLTPQQSEKVKSIFVEKKKRGKKGKSFYDLYLEKIKTKKHWV